MLAFPSQSPALARCQSSDEWQVIQDPHKQARNGFSLLEMLVALAVFALAALTLLRMESASLSQTADLDQRFMRELVIQNLAAEWLTDPAPPSLGESNGRVENAGRQFSWQRTVTAGPIPGSVAIQLSVSEQTPGATGQAITMTFLRAAGE